MKKSDKYPAASEEQIKSLPPMVKFLGLHPLVWVAIVVLLIAGARACDTVDDLGCAWFDFGYEDSHPHNGDGNKNKSDSESDHGEKGNHATPQHSDDKH